MELLSQTLSQIQPTDKSIEAKLQHNLDNLTKPQGSLGRLEEFATKYAIIKGTLKPTMAKRRIYTFAADHGIADRGVSLFPKEVTPQMVYNFIMGGAGVNVLARHANADVKVVDIGVNHDFADFPGLIHRKVRKGTDDFIKSPAMTRSEAIKAIETGILLSEEAFREGIDILGTGEMGIGNTTPASAITSVLTGVPVEEVTGRGTGIGDETLACKISLIREGIQKNNPDPDDPIDVLSKVGGLEIAGIAGLILGAANRKMPVVVDGFISSAAALVAYQLNPLVKDYAFASHKSVEIGYMAIMRKIGLIPILDLNMRLGEGTGACLAIYIIEAGVKILTEMATFGEAGVSEAEKE